MKTHNVGGKLSKSMEDIVEKMSGNPLISNPIIAAIILTIIAFSVAYYSKDTVEIKFIMTSIIFSMYIFAYHKSICTLCTREMGKTGMLAGFTSIMEGKEKIKGGASDQDNASLSNNRVAVEGVPKPE